FKTTSTVEIYTLSLHDALPISEVEIGEVVIKPELTKEEKEQFRTKAEGYRQQVLNGSDFGTVARLYSEDGSAPYGGELGFATRRSEEHTSELQSRENLVCRLLL